MNVWPVLAREVRQASRQPTTYRVRSLAALILLAVTAWLSWVSVIGAGMLRPGEGGAVFASLHMTLFVLTWFFVPVLAADCLSRERREGTMGLLFLTPLGAVDVVVAKVFLQMIRAATIWLAALPLLMVPVLLGGVSLMQAAVAALHDLSAMLLALAAGLIASAWTRQWGRSVIGAIMLALAFGALFVMMQGWLVVKKMVSSGSPVFVVSPALFSEASLQFGLIVIGQMASQVSRGVFVPGGGTTVVTAGPLPLSVSLEGLLISAVILGSAILMAAWSIRRNWREEPPSALRIKVQRGFTTPLLGRDVLKRWLRGALSRNPVGWLELRTWTGRVVMLGWMAVVIGIITGLLTQYDFLVQVMRRMGYDALPRLVAVPLLLSMAASAAGSFRRERETGLLELLLVSPMSAQTVVWGRMRGLYVQFLPSVVLLACAWIFLSTLPGAKGSLRPLVTFVIAAFATPGIGLYFSLRLRTFIGAFLLSVACAFVLPWLLAMGAGALSWALTSPAVVPLTRFDLHVTIVSDIAKLAFGALAIRELVRRLEARQFEFNREVT